jgi:hypothetical protein
MYPVILAAHNIVRWLVLLAGVWALYRAFAGWSGGRVWTPADRRAGFFLSTAFDLQVLLGLILAAVSPLTQAALAKPGAIMGIDSLRFFFAEHIPFMILAVVVVHVTSAMARRAEPDAARFRRSSLGYTLALLVVAVAIPWWRPLFPGL